MATICAPLPRRRALRSGDPGKLRQGRESRDVPGRRGELFLIHVSNTLAAWRTRRRAIDGCSIGFVPTMGALHRGHSSLVERCRGENQVAVVSAPSIKILRYWRAWGLTRSSSPACGNCIEWLPLPRGAARERSSAGRLASAGFPAGRDDRRIETAESGPGGSRLLRR